MALADPAHAGGVAALDLVERWARRRAPAEPRLRADPRRGPRPVTGRDPRRSADQYQLFAWKCAQAAQALP